MSSQLKYVPENQECFLCSEKIESKTINYVEVMKNEYICVANLIKKALDREISSDELRISYFCSACYKNLYTFFCTEQKMNQLKLEMMNKFMSSSKNQAKEKMAEEVEKAKPPVQVKEEISDKLSQNNEITFTKISSTKDGSSILKIEETADDDADDFPDNDSYSTDFIQDPENGEDEENSVEYQFITVEAENSQTENENEAVFEIIIDKYYRCLLCEYDSNASQLILGIDCFEISQLLEHAKSNHPEKVKIFEEQVKDKLNQSTEEEIGKTEYACNKCFKVFLSKKVLEDHTNFVHSGGKPWECTECKKRFATPYSLSAHLKTHTERPRNYKCLDCEKSFYTNAHLVAHQKTHSENKDYKCEECGKMFGNEHNLNSHSIIHSGNKPYVCRVCNKSFARRAEIRDHERTHTGDKPFKCETCARCFAQRSNLQSHIRATHLKDLRYKCELCSRAFKRQRLLDYHIKAAHTKVRDFSCPHCPSQFIYPEHYKKHLRIHQGIKPYKCEVCKKSFTNIDNRNVHRFVHSNKKPYECIVCHKGFNRKKVLLDHMKNSNHVSDTIIINQPKMTKDGLLFVVNNTSKEANSADEAPDLELTEEAEQDPLTETYTINDTIQIHENTEIIPEQFINDSNNVVLLNQLSNENQSTFELVQITLPPNNG